MEDNRIIECMERADYILSNLMAVKPGEEVLIVISFLDIFEFQLTGSYLCCFSYICIIKHFMIQLALHLRDANSCY